MHDTDESTAISNPDNAVSYWDVKLSARRKAREILDKVAQRVISLGGIGVIVTLLLLFVFLLYEVAPLFQPAGVEKIGDFTLEAASDSITLHLAVEEQAEVGLRVSQDATATFFSLPEGVPITRQALLPLANASVSSFAAAEGESGLLALGLDDGSVQVVAHEYQMTFSGPNNQREVLPAVSYPLGQRALEFFPDGTVSKLAISSRNDSIVLAALSSAGELGLLRASRQQNLIAAFDPASDQTYEIQLVRIPVVENNVETVLIGGDQRSLLLFNEAGHLSVLSIENVLSGARVPQATEIDLTLEGQTAESIQLLLGGVSFLLTDTAGNISQWFINDQDETQPVVPVRSFAGSGAVVAAIVVEQRQKNFVSVDANGEVRGFNTTASREIFAEKMLSTASSALAVAPRGDALLLESGPGQYAFWQIDNPHPDVSWSALWDRVWYEGYAGPDYVWQSSATSNAFEPKYSLVPLSFGTLKAAFYAMLLAAPLAICGAIFTGYFMAPAMRRKVKPLIELMEALPTVVLGFLAGLWLAPFVEQNLLGVFAVIIILPLSVLVASFAWLFLPKQFRHNVPDGWEAALLLPVILLFGWLAFFIAPPIEALFFGGDLQGWISNDLGINYDQRNAMVVGFAMGFAVIPTVFSIAEDAIFTVPRHLSYGSLALGATPWQSLYRVILPTASPGIFSALMIGLGRAVGETMIVLMATGNTPIMDINIFEGMRTLAANIAVEIPESEVDSTHYRILFLAALVLFMFTFMINTVAEVVRQRLRSRYSVL